MQENKLAIFEEKEIRREWYKEDWYFSVVDVIEALVENNKRPRKMCIRDRSINGYSSSKNSTMTVFNATTFVDAGFNTNTPLNYKITTRWWE